jgi:hypothetical protein
MSNTYDISEQDERELRARDKACVYCRVLMKQYPHAMGPSGATIERFNNDGPFDRKFNAAICCRRCNSSKGTKTLLGGWLTHPRGTGVNPCAIETRGVPNLFCALCRKGSGFDFAVRSFVFPLLRSFTRAMLSP